MDKIAKALLFLSVKEKKQIKLILNKILIGDLAGLDLKKLKRREDVYRVRKGKFRIIFHKTQEIKILTIERRCDTTYDF